MTAYTPDERALLDDYAAAQGEATRLRVLLAEREARAAQERKR